MKSLPARPSLESLRKQAKQLARAVNAGDSDAIARARAQLPRVEPPLSQRNAQLVIAREYGYAGWQDLTAEVHKRLGTSLDWAIAQARRAIHNNDVERLQQLLAEYPALLSWQGDRDEGGLLGMATGAYGDAGDEQRERWFTRAACAELLIDAGAVVTPSVCQGILQSRARGLLQLFQRKGLLPRTLEYFAALGDFDAVRAALADDGHNFAAVYEAFLHACSFQHEAVASLLLERMIELDADLGRRIDESVGRQTFVQQFMEEIRPRNDAAGGPWQAFVMQRVLHALHSGDLASFVSHLQRESWLLGDAHVPLQNEIISAAAVNGRGDFIAALLDLEPAIVRRQPPPTSQAIEFAITYGHTDLLPLLTRIWPLPHDLAHAAGTGNMARVKQWFDESGAPALGNVDDQFPHNGLHQEANDPWEVSPVQKVLDTALAWAVTNHHFEVADFLLAHGADINTRWNSHEPASILHHLVFYGDYESMQYVIDRGIDLSIHDYRWDATARGWAFYAKKDEQLADWLKRAEEQRAGARDTPAAP